MTRFAGSVLSKAFAVAFLAVVAGAIALGAQTKTVEKMNKSRFLVVSPHTKEQCLKALDDVMAEGTDALSKYDWGCAANDHTGYAIVEAASESDALKMVPADIRAQAHAVKLVKFTPEQIKAFHAEH